MTGRWALTGAALGLMFGVLSFAPALWLANAVTAYSGGYLRPEQARGSVWRGDARLVLSGGDASHDAVVLPGRVAWRWRIGLGQLGLQLRADCCTPSALELVLKPRWRGAALVIADSTSRWPAAILTGLGAPWNTVRVEGWLRLQTERLSVEWAEGRASVSGGVTLDALEMSSRMSTIKPMGSYRLRLTGSAGVAPPLLQLETLDGSLRLSGSGRWNGSRWGFRGEASAAPEYELALGNLLNIVGRRQGAVSVIALD